MDANNNNGNNTGMHCAARLSATACDFVRVSRRLPPNLPAGSCFQPPSDTPNLADILSCDQLCNPCTVVYTIDAIGSDFIVLLLD
jgi:hypothetical protein